MPIDLSCSLNFTLPVTKILLCKVRTYFSLDSRHSMARDIMNINLFLLITYYHAYKTLLRDGVAHRSLICCTAYGKLRLSTFFDVGTDKAAWRRITRVETSRLVNLVATVRPVRYSGRGRGRRAWLRALMLMTMVIMAISMVMIDDNDVDNKFDDGESKVK